MDVLFKNHYTQTEGWIKEYCLAFLFKRLINIVVHLLALAYLVLAIYRMVFFHIIDIIAFFVPIYWTLMCVLMYSKLNRTYRRRLQELNQKNGQVFNQLTEAGIETVSDVSQCHIAYDAIKVGYRTPNYIFLLTKGGLFLTFRRNGFLVGNEEEFLRYLREKGIRVR